MRNVLGKMSAFEGYALSVFVSRFWPSVSTYVTTKTIYLFEKLKRLLTELLAHCVFSEHVAIKALVLEFFSLFLFY